MQAQADAKAAEAAALAQNTHKKELVAALEDAMQVEEDKMSLQALRPDLHVKETPDTVCILISNSKLQ